MFAQAIMLRQIWAIIFGRAVYGLGTEITGVLANSIITQQFTLVAQKSRTWNFLADWERIATEDSPSP